jgi:hypothetical protein
MTRASGGENNAYLPAQPPEWLIKMALEGSKKAVLMAGPFVALDARRMA